MKPPFHLLLIHGDGSRALRCRVPRWLAYGTVGSVAVAAVTVLGLGDDYVRLRRDAGEVAALRGQVDEQGRLIAAFQTRIAGIRTEVTSWTALHAKMWKTFGPQAGPGAGEAGLGGGTPAPLGAGARPRPSEELDLLAATVAREAPRVRELERVVRRTGKIVNALPLRWPVRGRVNSGYGVRPSPWTGERERHEGMDIGVPWGTPVKAPAPGTVVAAGVGGGYGRYVRLDHGHGVTSIYGHLQRADVKRGQRVRKGQVIGLAGSTGRSTGPHLHYEVRVEGRAVDPRGFLWEH
jgi:murein DD-endopeptidase MepM/ murein hydrolase activator NlpD